MMKLIYKLAATALFVLVVLSFLPIALAANPLHTPTEHTRIKNGNTPVFSSLTNVDGGSFAGNFVNNLVNNVQLSTTVSFTNLNNQTSENTGTYLLCVAIENADTLTATTAEIVLTTGDSTKIGDYATQTVTFAAGITTDACVTLTFADNDFCLGNQNFTFEIQNIAGGNGAIAGANSTTNLTIEDDELEMLNLVAQSFEGSATDDWAVTPSPATYNQNGDVWQFVANLGGLNPSAGNLFWGMQDLNNLSGGGAFDHVLDFATVDVTGAENAVITFDYNVVEFDTGDSLSYEIYLDGVGQGEILLVAGNDATPISTAGWTTEVVNIPNGTTSVALQIRVAQDGNDQAGVDRVAVQKPGCSCLADAGDIATTTPTSDFSICTGEGLLDNAMNPAVFVADFAAADEADAGSGYEYAFILVENSTGTIIENNTAGAFDFSNKNVGTYVVYGLSYWVGNSPNNIDAYLNAIKVDATTNDVLQIQNDEINEDFCLNFEALNANNLPFLITISESIAINLAKADPTACAATDGAITISGLVNGTFYDVSYTVNGNPTGSNSLAANAAGEIILLNLVDGNYEITVEANGCSDTKNMELNEPIAPTLMETHLQPVCSTSNTGSIDLTVLDGSGDYDYLWASTDGTGLITTIEDQENLSPGTYAVTVSDNVRGCTVTLSVVLTGNQFPAPAAIADIEVCETVAIVLEPVAVGQTTESFNFYNGDPVNGGQLLGNGLTYTVAVPTIVPADGAPHFIFITAVNEVANCESVESVPVKITVNPLLTAAPTPMNTGICLGSSKNFNGNPSGGTAPYTHNWAITGGTATGVVLENNTSQIVSVNAENATNGMIELTYTVEDAKGCAADPMVFWVEIGACEAMISDPCACLNNATTTTNGQFSEEVEITGPAGQIWTVGAVTGLFQTNSAAPPAAPTPIAAGAMFTEVSPGVYHLEGIHLDANGYSLTAQEAGGQQLTIANTCFYANPVITGLDSPICLFTNPFPLTFEANGVAGTPNFTINGNTATEVNPMALGVGTHTVELTFEAGTALGYLVVNGAVAGAPNFAATLAEAMSNPGCDQSVSTTFVVENTPVQMACNNQINFSLNQNCEVLILPDMILEGDYNCYDDYGVTIKKNNFLTIANPITGDYIGDNLTVTITHLPSGNSCWTAVTVQDYFAPYFATCPDVTVQCYQNIDDVPFPIAVDNCTSVPFVFKIDQVTDDSDECNGVTIAQTFVATDFYNNESAPCTRTIFIPTPSLPDLAGDATWTCEQYAQFPTITNAAPTTNNLATTGSGFPTKIDGTYCNFGYVYTDDTLTACGNTFKIIRTWTVFNWCTGQLITVGGNGEDNVQIIAVLDETGPVITANPVTVSANINGQHPQVCRSTGFIPPATVTDNCNSFTTKIYTPVGEVIYANGVDGQLGGSIPAPGLALGNHTITYSATDDCGNVSQFTAVVTVIDDIVPVAICDFITTVNLTNDGTDVVFAETFDDGSYDNCCLDDFKVRRMSGNCGIAGNTTFSETVTFCCADIALSPILVAFQVIDCFGNTNQCMVQVNVGDNLAPSIVTCPAPQSITCDTYNDSYEPALLACGQIQPGMTDAQRRVIYDCRNAGLNAAFGQATFYDNCTFDIHPTVVINLNQCDAGNIIRTWRAKDGQGYFSPICTQTITVQHVSDFEVAFPPNYEVTDCTGPDDFEPENLPAPFNEPEIFFETCELIATSHSDQVFTVVNDACYKIVRTWTIINWCTVGDEIADELPDPFVNGRYRDGGDGFIRRQQQIKINDTTAPVLTCATVFPVCITENCAVNIVLPQPNAADCSDEITLQASSVLGNGFVYNNVGVGSYQVSISATDNCGNTSTCNTTVVVTDCKLPTPYCKDGIVLELMNTTPPMVPVWATDLDEGSTDNCGLAAQPFGIELLGAGGAVVAGSPTTQSINFDCDMVGTQLVRIYVTDVYGLQDFCTTFVEIQDNMNSCINNIVLGGRVETIENEGVNEVEMFVSGAMSSVTMTNLAGEYNFDDLIVGGDYTVVPEKDTEPRNGVTTLDLVYIKKHILNIQPLANPYQMIAADANKSNSITTLDLVELQKLILVSIPTFQNNTSWRFVPKSYVFPNPNNPWQTIFPEIKNYNNLPADQMGADFFGIKIGDLNGSADPAKLLGADDRSFTDELTFTTKNLEMKAGQEYSIEFTSEEIAEIIGYQFTLNFDPTQLEFVEVRETKVTSPENFGFALLDEGVLTASWNSLDEVEMAADEAVFHLVFRAITSGELKDRLQINSRYTMAEAYPKAGAAVSEDIWAIKLSFDENGHIFARRELNLYQNKPNPFANSTLIGFEFPQAGRATLTIYDVTGQLLYEFTDNFAAGYQEITVQKADLGNSGVLLYRIATDEDSAVRKMIVE